MQRTPEIDGFLKGIQENDGPEMHDTCVTVIEGLSDDAEFHTFAVRQKALRLLNYEGDCASQALSAQPFDSRTDAQRTD